MTRSNSFIVALLAMCVVCLCVGAPTQAKPREGVEDLFAPGSIWNKPLSDGARLDPTSPGRSRAFEAQINREIELGWGPWISDDSYSTPIYTVGRGQREVPVILDVGPWGTPLKTVLAAGVPIPPSAQPAEGSDGHMTIYQPSTDRLWEFWRAHKEADGWHASWGGAMEHVSRNPGYYTDDSWAGLDDSSGWNWGSTASSLPVAAGTITIADLRSGRIDHALALSIPTPCEDFFTWPAQRTDGTSGARDCLPEGAHLRIDPDIDLSKLDLPPISLMIARAAQRYGMIVRDRTGHATGFYAEDPGRTTGDPYSGRNGLYDGLDPWEFLPQLPWDHVQLLRMNICHEAPCAEPRS